MDFINLTPHPVSLYRDEELVATFPPSGKVARVRTVTRDAGRHLLVPVVEQTAGEVEGLPDPDGETIYIVSLFVRQALRGRTDVVAPDTGPESVVRDADGRIIGVRRWIGPRAEFASACRGHIGELNGRHGECCGNCWA